MIRLRLFFEDRWIAEGEAIKVSAETLEELDAKVAEELKKLGKCGRIEVRYEFDMNTIPSWMRQFQQHYFNRRVILDLD